MPETFEVNQLDTYSENVTKGSMHSESLLHLRKFTEQKTETVNGWKAGNGKLRPEHVSLCLLLHLFSLISILYPMS